MIIFIKRTGDLEEIKPKKAAATSFSFKEIDELGLWVKTQAFKTRKLHPQVLKKIQVDDTEFIYFMGYTSGKVLGAFAIEGVRYYEDACAILVDEASTELASGDSYEPPSTEPASGGTVKPLSMDVFMRYHDMPSLDGEDDSEEEKEYVEPDNDDEELVETDYED